VSEDPTLKRLDALAPLGVTIGAARAERAERKAFVRDLFDRVAPRYDLMNDLMSFGLHRLWKRAAVLAAASAPGVEEGTVIDLAGGTGDLALALRHRLPHARIILADASPGMVSVAKERAKGGFECIVAEAEDLPFGSGSAHAVMLSFGLRNMTDPPQALREVARILKPGGHLILLEFSKPSAWFAPFYDLFSRFAIPALGAAVSGNRGAYRYLVESIRLFPDADSITRELQAAGFADVTVRRFMFGVAALHVAEVRA
jgi:demethylmenaquinone methyltransferase/2-methoxy-6-polyprenyl-1,4-benzoquinol methylase